jgi:hypothetical protein
MNECTSLRTARVFDKKFRNRRPGILESRKDGFSESRVSTADGFDLPLNGFIFPFSRTVAIRPGASFVIVVLTGFAHLAMPFRASRPTFG